MTSQHSYFYQADPATDITDSQIEQTSIDNIDFAAMGFKPDDKTKAVTNLTMQAAKKGLKVKAKVKN